MKYSKMKILVVEDELDIRELIHFHLFKNKFNVFLAEDGEEALKIIEKESPDLIILDLMLPKVSGLEICKFVKSQDHLQDILILMATARGDEADIIKGFNYGADDYVTKPFSPNVLIARVKALLKRNSNTTTETKGSSLTYLGIKLDLTKRKNIFISKDKKIYDQKKNKVKLL